MHFDDRAHVTAIGMAIVATMTSMGFWFTVVFLYLANTMDGSMGRSEVLLSAFFAAILTAFTWAFATLVVR